MTTETATPASHTPTRPHLCDFDVVRMMLGLAEALAKTKGANTRRVYQETMEAIVRTTGMVIEQVTESATEEGCPLMARESARDTGEGRLDLTAKGHAVATKVPFASNGVAGYQILFKPAIFDVYQRRTDT